VLLATILALASAALHAGWNLLVKTSDDRDLATWGQFLFGGVLVLPVLAVLGLPESVSFPYLAASGLIHVAYVIGLVKAFHHGDFSLAYPLARGGGALLAAFGGVVLLGDHMGNGQWVGLLIVGIGLLSLVGGKPSRPAILWALFTAATIGAYTLVDSKGSRLSGNGMLYGFALMPCSAVCISASQMLRGRTRAFGAAMRTQWPRWLVAGVFLTAAYSMVMVAVRQTDATGQLVPVGHVTMLRESSVVMGALAGWLWLHEKLGRQRLISSIIIVVGLVTMVVFQAR